MIEEISKKARNGIKARIESTINKYGFEFFRLVANKYINDEREERKLQEDIEEKENELKELKKRK